MEQCCQRNVSGSRHLSHSKSSPRRRGTRHLRPPTPSRLQTGLEIRPSCHKDQLKNQSDTLLGDFLRGFPPHIARRARACPLGLRIFTAAMLQDPARADQPPPSRGLLGDSSGSKHAGLHRREPRTSSCHQPQPAYALCSRQEHPPSRRGTPEFNAASPPHKHKHKLASQLPCRKLSTPSAT